MVLKVKFIDSEKLPKEEKRVVEIFKSVLDSNLAMLNDPKYSDFTCIVGDRSFKVHKAVLAAASPVFDRMFSTAMAEAQSNEAKIDAIDPNIFEHLLRFIYGGKLPENLAGIAEDVFKAAHFYEIHRLKETCEDEMNEKLSAENAMEIYKLAYVYGLKKLKENARTVIKR
jgi:speckle-type POZ protein